MHSWKSANLSKLYVTLLNKKWDFKVCFQKSDFRKLWPKLQHTVTPLFRDTSLDELLDIGRVRITFIISDLITTFRKNKN